MHIHRTRIVITSSRDPSIRTRNFLNVLTFVLPDSVKITRGKKSKIEIFERAINLGALYLLFVLAKNENPLRIIVYDLESLSIKYFFKLSGLSLPSDYNVSLNQIKGHSNVCIKLNECDFLRDFLVDMNMYNLTNNCDVVVNSRLIHTNICELLFMLTTKNIKFLKMILEA
ncbi:Brix domain-containing protein [Saccharolobus solfataricus]|uniref:Probable Brix domain-containing ribosomal biogenesis protein n=1 Tax=Saccharolobus solfataricus TaxID=2287 RepID=A0A7S9NSD6_SACSO|nr:Brix domain-containing protein [Saccharolobus solfataricus]QPG50999.1 ribosomal biogenesis protein [Saccharolobus solfataricus]